MGRDHRMQGPWHRIGGALLLVTALAASSVAAPTDPSATGTPGAAIELKELARVERDARALYLSGDYAAALALLLTIDAEVRAAGDNPTFRWAVARCYSRLEQWPEALAAWQQFIAIAPDAAGRTRGEAELAEIRERALGGLAVGCEAPGVVQAALAPNGPYAPCPVDFGEVSAGPRTIYLRTDARRWTREVTVDGGRRTAVDIARGEIQAIGSTAEVRPPPPDEPGLTVRGVMAVNLCGLVGAARGWSLQPGLGLSVGAGVDYPVASAVDVSLAGLWHRQTQDWTWQIETDRATTYAVTLDSVELQLLGRLHVLGRAAPGLQLLAGAGVEYMLRSDARTGGGDTTALPVDPLQATASAGLGTVVLEGAGLSLRLDARAAIGVAPATDGDARLYRFGLASNLVF